MRRSPTRRKFLATLGTATTLSLAGCSAVLGPSGGGRGGGAPANTTPKNTSKTDTATNPDGTKTSTKTPTPKNTPFSRGEVVEDFEDNLKGWRALAGKVTIDRKNPYQGSQSVVLLDGENSKKTTTTATNTTNTTNSTNSTTTTTTTETTPEQNAVGMARSYYSSSKGKSGLDLRNHDLSMAVRFEQPVRGRIGVELIAPSQSISLTSRRFIPKELNGWTRIDLGYTGKEGNPVLKNVLGLRILVNTPGEPINVAIDDIRKIPKPKKGKVMFQFDDGTLTTYTEAFPRLQKRKWPAGASIIPDSIGTPENMTWANLSELGNAGWDMMSHPPVADPLPAYSPEKQERVIRQTKKTLELRGFKKGARHIVAPYGRVSNKTIEIMQKYHDTNYIFGGCPSNAKHPSNMYSISRVFGTAPQDALRNLLDLAEKYRQMIVLEYHEIGGNTGTSVSAEHFESTLKYVEKKNMDIVSPSQFLDSIKK